MCKLTITQTFLLLLALCYSLAAAETANMAYVHSWRAGKGVPYPEEDMLNKMGKSNSAITFSGGGLRSYMSTLGYLRGLLDLDLLNKTRYASAVSGGSWAVTAYTWHSPLIAKSPEDFLGPVVDPKDITWRKLRHIKTGCGRKVPVQMDLVLQALFNLIEDFSDPLDVWYKTIDQVFLKPVGITQQNLFAWNRERVADATGRNPWLNEYDFVLPCGGKDKCDHRPFPVINTAILGPEDAAPFSIFRLGYTSLETTPLYIGSPNPLTFDYKPMENPLSSADSSPRESILRFGGLVEPFGFGGFPESPPHSAADGDVKILPDPFFGLAPNETHKLLHVPRPVAQFTLANATGTSSWAPGSLLAEMDIISNAFNEYVGLRSSYWSPVTPRSDAPIFSSRVLLADGGSLDNQGLCTMLRRKVKNIAVFVTTTIPLQPRSKFNPFSRSPKDSDIDSGVSAFFGHFDLIDNPLASVKNNHVFPRSSFPFVADKMQRAQARGDGIVVKTRLRTIENKWWGIEKGHEVNVVWVYLGRVRNWEKQLPSNVRRLVVPPGKSANDITAVPTSGPFKNFPHIPTSKLNYSPELANMLANLAGWVVTKHRLLFEDLLN